MREQSGRLRSEVKPPRAIAFLPRLRAVAKLALLSIGVSAVALWLWEQAPWSRLPWLKIQEVEVHGEWPLTAEVIRRYLPPLDGKSLLLVKPSELISRLQEKPWVHAVTLKKEYPNRLFIDVSAKRAHAVITAKGEAFFVDSDGRQIDRATPALLVALDLPVITEPAATKWERAQAMRCLERVRQELEPEYRVSELSLDSPPFFRVFLAPARVEALFSVETFDAQLPRLRQLLDSASFPKWQPHRINLVFPKKAIVSAILSK